jgi:hypothetical protein
MKKIFVFLLSTALLCGFYSCSDDNIGSSISDSVAGVVMDSSFTVSGATVTNSKLLSRTITQLVGNIKATNYGSLKADFVTQFMPSNALDTAGVGEGYLDSLKLALRIPLGGYTGDSVVPMRVNVYKLSKQLPSTIYSDFDPSGYYSTSDLLGSASYTATALGLRSTYVDTLNDNGCREFFVKLPHSLLLDFYRKYKSSPETFATPAAFAKYFPGIYVTTSFGNGRVVNITDNEMIAYYRKYVVLTDSTDTVYHKTQSYLTAAPEVITNNNINLEVASSVKQMIANGDIIVQAPAGYEVSLKFPAQEIVNRFKQDAASLSVVNRLEMEIPVSPISNENGIEPPKYLLLVKTAKKDKFFADKTTTDNINSFYATYNASTHKYVFSSMLNYILNIINDENGVASDEDINMTLTPVDITTETSSSSSSYYYSSSSTTTVTAIAPAVQKPCIAKLLLGKAKIKLTYSKQTINY